MGYTKINIITQQATFRPQIRVWLLWQSYFTTKIATLPGFDSPCPSTQGARGAAVSRTRLQRSPEQQNSTSPTAGSELLLPAPSSSVGPAQKPALQDPAASGSQPQPVQHCRIHRGSHSRDTPVSFSGEPQPSTPTAAPSYFLWGYAKAERDVFENSSLSAPTSWQLCAAE